MVKDSTICGEIRADVVQIQLSKSEKEFQVASGLWMKNTSQNIPGGMRVLLVLQ